MRVIISILLVYKAFGVHFQVVVNKRFKYSKLLKYFKMKLEKIAQEEPSLKELLIPGGLVKRFLDMSKIYEKDFLPQVLATTSVIA